MAYGVHPRVVFRSSGANSTLIQLEGKETGARWSVASDRIQKKESQDIIEDFIKDVTKFQFFLKQETDDAYIYLNVDYLKAQLDNGNINKSILSDKIKTSFPTIEGVESHVMLIDDMEQKRETKLSKTSKYKCSVTRFNLDELTNSIVYFGISNVTDTNGYQSRLLISCLRTEIGNNLVDINIEDGFENTKSLLDLVALLHLEFPRKINELKVFDTTPKKRDENVAKYLSFSLKNRSQSQRRSLVLKVHIMSYSTVEQKINDAAVTSINRNKFILLGKGEPGNTSFFFELRDKVPPTDDDMKPFARAFFYYEAFHNTTFYTS